MADYEARRDAHLLYELRALSSADAALHIGTHPDDEETGLLVYLARGLAARTVYWSATRGEGGQNRIGPERQEALGVLRTWESLAASDIHGAELRYGPFYDFGFSKSGEDALSRWGRDRVVLEIVRAIRTVMPQVVISRWSGGPADGHGQHQAIGIATREAFAAAGDPARFPELLEVGLDPWQPLKLYHSMAPDWQPGEDDTSGQQNVDYERDGLLRIDTGAYDPIAGRSFQEQAAIAWNRHRTQALAFLPEWREFFLYYRLVDSLLPAVAGGGGFFDGMDRSLTGILGDRDEGWDEVRAALREAHQHAVAAADSFHPFAREKTAAALLEGLAALRSAGDWVDVNVSSDDAVGGLRRWLQHRTQAFEKAIGRLLGIDVNCLLEQARVTPGATVGVTARVSNKHGPALDAVSLDLWVPQDWDVRPLDGGATGRGRLDAGDTDEAVFDLAVPATAQYSTPYWFRAPRTAYAYTWPQGDGLGSPLDEPLVVATCTVDIGAHRVVLRAEGVHREAFPGGYRELPLEILPAITIEPIQRQQLRLSEDSSQRLSLQVTARCRRPGGAEGSLSLEVPEGWEVQPPAIDLSLDRERDSRSVVFDVDIPAGISGTHQLCYYVTSGALRDSVVLQPVHQLAPGLPGPAEESSCVSEVFIASPATVEIHSVTARFVPTLRYGYIRGAAEEVADALVSFGLELQLLTDEELSFADLSRFDTIVVGPNAYLLRSAVRKNAARLLEYVEHGGTLVVQYQAYGYEEGGCLPYAVGYNQPHDRVTRPDAPVTLLAPDHAALTTPNRLGESSFDNWIHDRGLYFFGEWDDRYTPLLASADPGEDPKRGGLMVASYGRGTYIYAAYSFFRQVPAGVEGAIKLFANLIGLPESRINERVMQLSSVPLLAALSDAQRYQIARVVSEEWFADGTLIAKLGEQRQESYLVLEGAIEVLKGGEGEWSVVYSAGQGEVVGELAALTELPRSASLRARGATRVLMMRGEDFRGLIEAHPDLAQDVLRVLATRLAISDS